MLAVVAPVPSLDSCTTRLAWACMVAIATNCWKSLSGQDELIQPLCHLHELVCPPPFPLYRHSRDVDECCPQDDDSCGVVGSQVQLWYQQVAGVPPQ